MKGLNQSSDQLAQLKDIHLPEQIHNYPVAFGWWILLACLLVCIAFLIIKWQKRRKLCHSQKLALARLDKTQSSDEIITLMKWAAFQYFPRNEVASLHGEQLESFFIQKLSVKRQDKFKSLCEQQFTNKYQRIENSSIESFKQAAHFWLSHAIPPKALKEVSTYKALTKPEIQS